MKRAFIIPVLLIATVSLASISKLAWADGFDAAAMEIKAPDVAVVGEEAMAYFGPTGMWTGATQLYQNKGRYSSRSKRGCKGNKEG